MTLQQISDPSEIINSEVVGLYFDNATDVEDVVDFDPDNSGNDNIEDSDDDIDDVLDEHSTTTNDSNDVFIATLGNVKVRNDIPQNRINLKGSKAVDIDGIKLEEIDWGGLVTKAIFLKLNDMAKKNAGGALPYVKFFILGKSINDDDEDAFFYRFEAKLTHWEYDAPDGGGMLVSSTLRVKGY